MQLDEPRPAVGLQRLDQRAEIGLVHVASELEQPVDRAFFDRRFHGRDEFGAHLAVLVAKRPRIHRFLPVLFEIFRT